MDGLLVYGPVVLWLMVIALLIVRPYCIPFTLKSVGLFLLIRSVFVSLTHIGPFPTHVIIVPSGFISSLATGSDRFFSGHTGLPFLLELIFWHDARLRIAFLIATLICGTAVLLGHIHYSIDVLAAFFITYTIHHLAEMAFKKDKQLFIHGLKK